MCTAELEALLPILPELDALGVTLVALSPQTVANNRKTATAHGLPFPLLSDPGARTAARFGVAVPLTGELRAAHEALGLDLHAFNAGDGAAAWVLPAPSHFLLAPDGRVLDADVSRTIADRPGAADWLASIRAAL